MDDTLLDKSGPWTARRQAAGDPSGRGRQDRCPGLLELHPAADGMLARLRLPGGRATGPQLAAIADLAADGNGIVELTSRANVQVRGLAGEASGSLVPVLASVGLLPSPAHERVRNVLASPLAGRHRAARIEADELVTALDVGLCDEPALAELPGRVLFLVDDGSGVLAGLSHDIALVATGSGEIALLVDGVDSGLRASESETATGLALEAARAFAAARAESPVQPGAWSVRELPRGAADVIARLGDAGAVVPVKPVIWPAVSPRPLRPGRTFQRDGRIALTALAPLGRLSGPQLRALAELASEVRVSPWRTVTVLDLLEDGASSSEDAFSDLGLVLDPESGWAGLSACAGLGACASARADVRAAAAARAVARAPEAPAEHWTACPRRCGERSDVGVAVSVVDAGVAMRRGTVEDVAPDIDAALAVLGGSG